MELKLLAKFYRTLLSKDIRIINSKEVINLVFEKSNLYHLAGFQYLSDISFLQTKKIKNNTLKMLESNDNFIENIKESKFYNLKQRNGVYSIKQRVYYFNMILWVIINDKICIWINNDESKIKADYLLYYEYQGKYLQLFIRKDEGTKKYYPVSFFYSSNDPKMRYKLKAIDVTIEISSRKY